MASGKISSYELLFGHHPPPRPVKSKGILHNPITKYSKVNKPKHTVRFAETPIIVGYTDFLFERVLQALLHKYKLNSGKLEYSKELEAEIEEYRKEFKGRLDENQQICARFKARFSKIEKQKEKINSRKPVQ